MSATVFCRRTNQDEHSFYLASKGDEFYLFSQPFHLSNQKFYSKGVTVNRAIDFSKSQKNKVIIRTMGRISSRLSYVEREYNIVVLDRTGKRENKHAYQTRKYA